MSLAIFFSETRFFDFLVLFLVAASFLLELLLARRGEAGKQAPLFKKLFLISTAIVVSYYFFLTYLQFWAWENSGPLTRFFLPPHTGWWFLFDYWFIRFLLGYAISFLIALVFVFSARKLNRRFGGRFFEAQEPWLGGLGLFLSGQPGWIFYLSLIFAIQLIRTGFGYLKREKTKRFSFRYLWLPTAMFVIILRVLGVIG